MRAEFMGGEAKKGGGFRVEIVGELLQKPRGRLRGWGGLEG